MKIGSFRRHIQIEPQETACPLGEQGLLVDANNPATMPVSAWLLDEADAFAPARPAAEAAPSRCRSDALDDAGVGNDEDATRPRNVVIDYVERVSPDGGHTA